MNTPATPCQPPRSDRSAESGVTLVELSIVLVILALLTAGVITGMSLLRGAEFRRVISDYQGYQMAVSNFETAYDNLPGDAPDAVTIWGMAPNASNPAANDAACAALTKNNPSQGKLTCNGDGDGTIAVGYEEFRAWQQLSAANMIDGSYTGVGASATAGEGYQAGLNCPKSEFRDACWRVFYRNSSDSHRDPFRLFSGNYETHMFSLWGGAMEENNFTPVMYPAEMWELDNKIDDGRPATGAIVTPHGTGAGTPFSGCTIAAGSVTDEDDTDAIYNNEGKERACQPYIKASF